MTTASEIERKLENIPRFTSTERDETTPCYENRIVCQQCEVQVGRRSRSNPERYPKLQ